MAASSRASASRSAASRAAARRSALVFSFFGLETSCFSEEVEDEEEPLSFRVSTKALSFRAFSEENGEPNALDVRSSTVSATTSFSNIQYSVDSSTGWSSSHRQTSAKPDVPEPARSARSSRLRSVARVASANEAETAASASARFSSAGVFSARNPRLAATKKAKSTASATNASSYADEGSPSFDRGDPRSIAATHFANATDSSLSRMSRKRSAWKYVSSPSSAYPPSAPSSSGATSDRPAASPCAERGTIEVTREATIRRG